jgi:hypothetical protein
MDDFDRLGLEIERECLITTFQAIIETIGSQRMMMILRPYFEVSGKAFFLNLSDWTKGDDVHLKLAKTMTIGQTPMGQECKSFRVLEGEAFFESEGCPFINTVPEICECYCTIFTEAFIKQIDPDLCVESFPGSSYDHRCRWRFYYKDRALMSGFFNKEIDVEKIRCQISDEELEWRAHHYIGGVWEMVTQALVEDLGIELIHAPLESYMRRNGYSYGLRIKRYLGIEGRDKESLVVALEAFGRSICQTHMIESSEGDDVRVIVDQCPFRCDLVTPEHCRLIEMINQGICTAINPEFSFKYESMTTLGEKDCIWSLGRTPSDKSDETGTIQHLSGNDDLLQILKSRLARGEISLDQYEKIKQILK